MTGVSSSGNQCDSSRYSPSVFLGVTPNSPPVTFARKIKFTVCLRRSGVWVLGSFGTPPEPFNQYHHPVNGSATERVNAENGTRMNCRAVRQDNTGLPAIAGNITIRAAGASWEPDEFLNSARCVRHPRARAMGGEKAGRLGAGLVRGALRLRGRRNSSFLRDTAPAYTHMLC